ncbi:hypothetical protein Pst134EA_025941 [Puccinia striiformis f. sp. tritici]|uniref:hypothetical protein n=1 Tax=Puccinia striiformis f. sp. tritici TaxID=168172 RepID=UPI002007B7F6|nr:hypothetical protein Pst134EA_025941 [Puccinia striiformis f. sp. tritici]KAH9452004.1 hypothetical protein Pst134EA_025941 [Puccinia striiformis f. sp. tritici]
MTVEDEAGSEFENDFNYHQNPQNQAEISTNDGGSEDFKHFLLRYQAIRDRTSHAQLQNDLIDHLWNKLGSEGDYEDSEGHGT